MVLHHDSTLTRRLTELKWSRMERRLSRSGRSGETSGTNARDSRKAYNRAHRKASKVQLSRYQTPVEKLHSLFTWDQSEDWHWDDFRTEADEWYEEKRFGLQCYSAHDYQDYMAEVYESGLS